MTAYELANDLAFKYIEGDDTGSFNCKIREMLRQQQAKIESLKESSKKAEQYCLDAFERGKQIGYADGMISRKAQEK
jgi:hypothetical protein